MTWLIHISNMTHPHQWHDSATYVTCRILQRDISTWVTWLVCVCENNEFICVTWPGLMRDTHPSHHWHRVEQNYHVSDIEWHRVTQSDIDPPHEYHRVKQSEYQMNDTEWHRVTQGIKRETQSDTELTHAWHRCFTSVTQSEWTIAGVTQSDTEWHRVTQSDTEWHRPITWVTQSDTEYHMRNTEWHWTNTCVT